MPSPILADAFGHHVWATIRVLDVLRGERESFVEAASDIATMRMVMEAHDEAWQHLIAGSLDPELDVVEYEDSGWETHAPLGVRLAQALDHGTDHRSQICTALTSIGIDPPAIQVWDYAERAGRLSSRPTGATPRA